MCTLRVPYEYIRTMILFQDRVSTFFRTHIPRATEGGGSEIYIYPLCPKNITYFQILPDVPRKYVLFSVDVFKRANTLVSWRWVSVQIPICPPVWSCRSRPSAHWCHDFLSGVKITVVSRAWRIYAQVKCFLSNVRSWHFCHHAPYCSVDEFCTIFFDWVPTEEKSQSCRTAVLLVFVYDGCADLTCLQLQHAASLVPDEPSAHSIASPHCCSLGRDTSVSFLVIASSWIQYPTYNTSFYEENRIQLRTHRNIPKQPAPPNRRSGVKKVDRLKWKYNTEMCLNDVGRKGVNWIYPSQN